MGVWFQKPGYMSTAYRYPRVPVHVWQPYMVAARQCLQVSTPRGHRGGRAFEPPKHRHRHAPAPRPNAHHHARRRRASSTAVSLATPTASAKSHLGAHVEPTVNQPSSASTISSSASSRQRGEATDVVPGQRESKSGSEIARGRSGSGRGRALAARAFSETNLVPVTSPEAMTSSAAWPRPRRKRRGHAALRLRAKLVAAGHLRPIASAPRAAGNRPLRGRSKLLRYSRPLGTSFKG